MLTKAIRTIFDRDNIIRFINGKEPPFTIKIADGLPRSLNQNDLQWKWYEEASKQGDMTANDYRAYCKLHFGVPILRAENEDWREAYDELFRGRFTYEEKLRIMSDPIDYPVTSKMTTKQMTTYLDKVNAHFRSLGFQLTEPF